MAQVPSNLIPTRITQLPDAPVASEDGLLVYVYGGNTYKIRAGDLLSVSGVPVTRNVNAGTALTGGGQLATDVTLGVAPGGIGTSQLAASGVTPGTYGSSTTVPVVTLDATGRVMAATTAAIAVSGYVPETRQVIAGTGLTGGGTLNTNVTLGANLSNSTPASGYQTGASGVATAMSRSDHKHPAVDLADDNEVDGLLGLNSGGTGRSLVAAAGAPIWSGADGLYVGPVGTSGQVLVSGGTAAPTWGAALVVVDKPANVVYAGPASGPAGPTTFRALVTADLPSGTGTVTSVTALTLGTAGTDLSSTVANSSTTPVITLNVPTASASNRGALSATDWTTFNNKQQAGAYLSAVDADAPLTGYGTSASHLSIPAATGSVNGYLTSTDWTTFNGKQPAGAYLTAVTADSPIVGSGTSASHLSMPAASGSVSGYLSSTDWSLFNGKGDVFGPASATDNAVARFDLATGKLIQNSVVTVDDTGNAAGILSQQFSNGAAVALAAGKFWYDGATGSWNMGMGGGNITQQVGEEMFTYGKASSAISDTNVQLIYKTGVVGASGVITFAPAIAGIADSDLIIGVATESLALNGFGRVTTVGTVHGVNTSGSVYGETWADNDDIWYNPVTGGLTKTKPVAPNIKVQVGTIINAGSGGSGSFYVRIACSSILGGTDANVQFGALADKQLIQYDSVAGYWKNVPVPTWNQDTTGSAATLTTPRNIAGVSFNGSADIAISMDNLSDTIITTPAVDQILKYNGVDWVNGPASSISAGYGIEYFNATPIITDSGTNNALPILTLSPTPITTAEQTATTTTINGTVAGNAWLSLALNRTTIDAGIWDWTVFARISVTGGTNTIARQMYAALPFVTGTVTTTGTGTTRTATASAGTPFATAAIDASATNTVASYLQTPQGLYQISARTSDTVVTIITLSTYVNESAVAGAVWKKLFATAATPTLTATITQYDVVSIQSAFTITATTKLGAITFVTSGNAGRTVTLTYNGTLRNTHMASPLAIVHNQLGGLNGGVADEYYHLTSADYVGNGTGLISRTDSPTFTTKITSPVVIGGTAVTDVLKLQGTSGVGTATAAAVQVKVGNNGGTTAMTVLNNGNVGIGATAPQFKLDVVSNARPMRIQNTDPAGYTELLIDNDVPYTGNTGSFVFGYGGTSTGQANSAYLVNRNNGPISFWTNYIERMRILGNGNVGIGTTTPAGKLDIKGAGTTTGITLQTQNSAGTVGLQVLDNGSLYASGGISGGTF